ncbi:MAG: aldose 1-epimerase [Clostridia bacterium]|nr:aldose 1-epimerase [Clostridia bacterium]
MIKDSITIKSGKWQAHICPRLGGNVIQLTYAGQDVLRPLDDEEQLKENPYLQGAPILMPANRTFEGRFSFEGREYSLPLNEPQNNCNLHGSVLYEAFDVVSTDEKNAVLRLVDKTCKSYPFPFSLTVTYSLSMGGLSADYEIENIGDGNMPLTFCLHTTFMEPEKFTVPIDMCQEKDSHHIPTGRYIELNTAEREIAECSPSRGKVISGYYRSCGNTAHVGDYIYSVSDNFDHWIFYNGAGKGGFLCVEPQAGAVNGLNTDDGHIVLSPGEKIRFETQISENETSGGALCWKKR